MATFSQAMSSRLSKKKKKSSSSSLGELNARVEELTARAEELGARKPETDSPGIFMRIVDVLSRPNYAVAGATEELLNGAGVAKAFGRGINELLSGVGPLEGHKRAFGEVLERQGMGTVTLGDVVPFLDGTWVGAMGSRGAAGLALDIFTDPLTYMTFGTSSVGKNLFAKGARYLNKSGVDELGKIKAGLQKSFDHVDDVVKREKQLNDAAQEAFTAKFSTDGGETFAKSVTDAGGIKFFGRTVVSGKRLKSTVSEPVLKALRAVPGGDAAIQSAATFGNGLRDSINSLFHPLNGLGNLPAKLRPLAIRLHRDFRSTTAMHRGRLWGILESGLEREGDRLNIAPGLAKRYKAAAKADPELGRKLYNVREGVVENGKKWSRADLTADQTQLLDEFASLAEDMGVGLETVGIFEKGQLRAGYFPHSYLNTPEEMRQLRFASDTPIQPSIRESFTKERVFETYADSVETSKALNAVAKQRASVGKTDRLYPELLPNYDVLDNFNRYIDRYADSMARQAWHEEVATRFGKNIDRFDPNDLYELNKGFNLAENEAKLVEGFFGDRKIVSAQKVLDKIVLDTDGAPRVGKLRDAVKKHKYYEEVEVPLSGVRFSSDGVLSSRADPGKGAIVIDGSGNVIDGRHRALLARERGQKTIRVLRPTDDLSKRKSNFKQLLDEEAEALEVGLKANRDAVEGAFFSEARGVLNKLSETGKREFMQRMVLQAKSSSQLASMMNGLWDDFADYLPRATFRPGDLDASYAKMFGNDAVYIPVKSKFTGDEGALIPKIIWDDFVNVNSKLLNTKEYKGFGQLIKGFDTTNNIFKLGVYTFWPASIVRDGYSNLALSMQDIALGALNPKSHLDTVGIMAGRNGTLKTKQGVRYAWGDLRKMARDMGVWVPGEQFAELTGDAAKAGTVTKGLKKAANVRGLIENEARVQLWIQNIRRGVDPRQAADHVSEFLFNYSELSQFEREIMRRAIPFYTFTRKNIALQTKMLRKNPGMSINQLKPFRQRNSESESMVKWESEALAIRLDRDGKTLHVLTGIDLPLRNLDTLYPGTLAGAGRRWLGMLTPVLKVPLEATVGRDFFTGGNLERTQGPTMGRIIDSMPTPKSVKDWIGYTKTYDDAGRPKYEFDGRRYALLVRSWAFSRAFSTSDRQFREYVSSNGVDTNRALLDLLTGIRAKDLNMDEQQARKLGNRVRALQEVLRMRGAAKTANITYVPKGEVDFE